MLKAMSRLHWERIVMLVIAVVVLALMLGAAGCRRKTKSPAKVPEVRATEPVAEPTPPADHTIEVAKDILSPKQIEPAEKKLVELKELPLLRLAAEHDRITKELKKTPALPASEVAADVANKLHIEQTMLWALKHLVPPGDDWVDEAKIPAKLNSTAEMGKKYPKIVIDGVKLQYIEDQQQYVDAITGKKMLWMEFGGSADKAPIRMLATRDDGMHQRPLRDPADANFSAPGPLDAKQVETLKDKEVEVLEKK